MCEKTFKKKISLVSCMSVRLPGCLISLLLLLLVLPVSTALPSSVDEGPTNASILWQKDLSEFIGASPTIASGRVYIGVWPDMAFTPGEEYHLFCLDAETGEEIWRNPLGIGEGTVSRAVVAGDLVFIGCMDGMLYAIDRMNGTTVWKREVDLGRTGGGNWYGLASTPVVNNGIVYVNALTNGTLHAISVEGDPLWTYTTGNATFAYSSPALSQDLIFFAGHGVDHLLVAVNTVTGEEVWSAQVSAQVRSTPLVSGDTVYLTTVDHLYAFDADGGSVRWQIPISGSWSTPSLEDGRLYLGTNADRSLHCLDASTGDSIWSLEVNGKVDTSPAVAGDTVYFASNTGEGTIYAVTTSGDELWQYQTTNYIMSSPSVADGILFIGTDEGILYAFGETSPSPVIWDGTVSLLRGSTTQIPISENETRTISSTTPLGALDAAATIPGAFNYTAHEIDAEIGISSIGGFCGSWVYEVNGEIQQIGPAEYTLSEGDVVSFWYGDDPLDTARPRVIIHTTIRDPVSPGGGGGEGGLSWQIVLLQPGTITIYAHNSGKTYDVNQMTALGALHASGSVFTLDDSYYPEYGSLFINSIHGRQNAGAEGWMYQVNGVTPAVGSNVQAVNDGDEVVFYWSESMASTPATSSDVIPLRISVRGSTSPSGGSQTVSLQEEEQGVQPSQEPLSLIQSISLSPPQGVMITPDEEELWITVDIRAVESSNTPVTFTSDTIIITMNELVLTLSVDGIEEENGILRGRVRGIDVSLHPIHSTLPDIGDISARLNLSLLSIPDDGKLMIRFDQTIDQEYVRLLRSLADDAGVLITGVPYIMIVEPENLQNGIDIKKASVYLSLPNSWVMEHGGVDAIRIAHLGDDVREIQRPDLLEHSEDGMMTFRAESPSGLSMFALLSVEEIPAPAKRSMTEVPEQSAVIDPALQSSEGISSPIQGWIVVIFSLLILGSGVILEYTRRRENT
jgi:outer membrane protein assembly factor BamB